MADYVHPFPQEERKRRLHRVTSLMNQLAEKHPEFFEDMMSAVDDVLADPTLTMEAAFARYPRLVAGLAAAKAATPNEDDR